MLLRNKYFTWIIEGRNEKHNRLAAEEGGKIHPRSAEVSSGFGIYICIV